VEFPVDCAKIEAFLTGKWSRELGYRLIKGLWTFAGNRSAVRFTYEYRDDSSQWFRAYGNENWQFDAEGLMELRYASINERPIAEKDRKFRWPLGRRRDDHPDGHSARPFASYCASPPPRIEHHHISNASVPVSAPAIIWRAHSTPDAPTPIAPRPPASETAATIAGEDMPAIGAWRMGSSMCRS